jgi:hypothetical protein
MPRQGNKSKQDNHVQFRILTTQSRGTMFCAVVGL